MTVTHTHNPSQSGLTVEQLNAIDVLVTGAPDREAAVAAGVARETVTRWRNDNPRFQAELSRQRQAVWGEATNRLRGMVPKALDVLETAVDDFDVSAAVQVLRAVGLYGNVGPPPESTQG